MKTKLYEKVIGHIKEDIAGGKFIAGEKMPPEHDLMKMYGVGRSSIREAVKTLANSGVLTVQQGNGTLVNSKHIELNIEQRLRRADFDDINSVRSVLEKEIVKLSTKNHSEQQINDIEQWLKKRKAAIHAENTQDCADADIEFHMAIANASGNPVLADLYYHFTVILRNFFSARDRQGITYFALNHYLHEQLFNAIKNKDAEQAQTVLQYILDNNY